MKYSIKSLFIISLSCFALVFIGYLLMSKPCISCEQSEINRVNNSVKPNTQSLLKQNIVQSTVVNHKNTTKDKDTGLADNTSQSIVLKKAYEDDWCMADVELNESDYNFAKSEVQDWDIQQGKAKVKGSYSSYADELLNPNNSLVAAYEALPLEQLEHLALEGDKWAMVAFVQNKAANDTLKNKVAKKLLVEGASYYALEYLVVSRLTTVKTRYRRSGLTPEVMNLITDALTYAYWGMEQYNDGGLHAYFALVSREPFKSNIPLDILLPQYENEIQQKYDELAKWIQEERDKVGINRPKATKAVQRGFAENIAVRQYLSQNEAELFNNLPLTKNSLINNSPCAVQYLTDYINKLGYIEQK